MAGRCLAKRSLVPNDLYGVLHASELKWRGGDGFYTFASDAAPAAERVGGVRVKGKQKHNSTERGEGGYVRMDKNAVFLVYENIMVREMVKVKLDI
ncbi:unnamed protein product [Pieris macdunnoughi]|uniref:Uncharacterized protein n=1 Tax=Pieris macdunnoughi TaxID=345717 RepID=A0A821MBP3_9NEOP|nr:unnamed protein product [Pieris macdunnoughi]